MEALVSATSNIATNWILKKFKMDYSMFGSIYTIFSSLNSMIFKNLSTKLVTFAILCVIIYQIQKLVRLLMYEQIFVYNTHDIIDYLLNLQKNKLKNKAVMSNFNSMEKGMKYYFNFNKNRGYVISKDNNIAILRLFKYSKMNITEFWEYLNNEYKKQRPETTKFISVGRYIDNTQISICDYKIYEKFDLREAVMQKTYFHKNRDMIIDKCKIIINNKKELEKYNQSKSINLLLYGPPGTGKTSIAVHLSKLFGRNLTIFRFTPETKKTYFYTLMQSEGVILFDEIDIGIKKLYENELKKNNKLEFENKMMKLQLSNKDSSTENNKKDESNENIEISDLIEIFQSVENNTRICIATTNDYEEIYKICPKLFRFGRLTPIYFGYLEKKELEEISMAYFDTEIDLPQNLVNEKPTTEIMAKALELKFDTNLTNEIRASKFQEYIMKVIVCK